MIKLILGSKITITNYNNELLETLKKVLTLPNPAYEKIKRLTGNPWVAQRDFHYYREKDGIITIPRGMRDRLIKWLDAKQMPYEIVEDKYVEIPLKDKKDLSPRLMDYQKAAVEKMYNERIGICEIGTGGGKTLTMLSLINKIGLTACILVPTLPIMTQFIKEAKDFYDIKIGQVGDGKKEIDYDIVVSTFQSLSADKELLVELSAKTSILIQDECQQSPATGRVKILQSFNAKHVFGTTATAIRSDGKTDAIGFLLGEVKFKYEETPLVPRIEVIATNENLLMSINYNEIIDDMINNESRNTLIAGTVLGELLAGRRVLVLTKRIVHYHNIKKKLPESDKIIYIESNDKEREEKLLQLNDGRMDFGAIFGTTALLAVGVNLKPCDTLIIACDIACEALTRQSIGRILRKADGKQDPLVIDLFDNKHSILKRQFYSRKKVYESQGWSVTMPWATK